MGDHRPDRKLDRWDAILAAALVLGGLLILIWTVGDFGLTWDEPTYVDQALEYLDYFCSRGPENPFSWSDLPGLFETKDRHPPLHRWIALPLLWLLPAAPRLLVARGATLLTSSLLLAVVYLWGRRRLGRPAAAGSSLLLLLCPRFFAHAHLFALDAAITFWWALTLWLFYEGRNRWGLWGLACAAFTGALLTKFTAVMLPVILLLWIIICRYGFRGPKAMKYDTILDWILKLYLMGLIGAVLFFALWPMFWVNLRYHVLNYVTFQMKHFNAGVYYFGRYYSGEGTPGWHYPWVMLLSTLPPVHLLLLALGGWVLGRGWKDAWSVLVLLAALFPLLLFSAPTIPKYDGVRLFLTAFPALALIMGCGLQWVSDRLASRADALLPLDKTRWKAWAVPAICCLIAAGSLLLSYPHPLSHYNVLVGGLKGAERLGLPLTYWGEILDSMYPDINRIVKADDTLFPVAVYGNLHYPHTVTDQPGDAHHLKPGIRLSGFSPERIEEATTGQRFLLVVRRGKAVPDDVAPHVGALEPAYEFSVDGVSLARLYALPPPGEALRSDADPEASAAAIVSPTKDLE